MLKSSIDPSLLIELVELREFTDVSEVFSLTDEGMCACLDSKLKPDEDDLVSLKDITNTVRRAVRINTQKSRPKLRIKRLFVNHRHFMRTQEWSDIVENAMEEFRAHICALLPPL